MGSIKTTFAGGKNPFVDMPPLAPPDKTPEQKAESFRQKHKLDTFFLREVSTALDLSTPSAKRLVKGWCAAGLVAVAGGKNDRNVYMFRKDRKCL